MYNLYNMYACAYVQCMEIQCMYIFYHIGSNKDTKGLIRVHRASRHVQHGVLPLQ